MYFTATEHKEVASAEFELKTNRFTLKAVTTKKLVRQFMRNELYVSNDVSNPHII
jgi:hypothetical protein